MKLSDIKGEIVIDVIADLIVPIANIAVDSEASELFSRKPLPVGMTNGQFMAARAKKTVPALLRNHKDDVIDILATIAMKDKEEYLAGLTITSLLKDAYEVVMDDIFVELFYSAQTSENEESSGSAQENTEEEA